MSCMVEMTTAAAGFDCKFSANGKQFDLTPLSNVATYTNSTPTPPSSSQVKYSISLCAPLPREDNVADRDQCPPNTRACLLRINQKDGEQDRVTSVVPVAGGVGELNPTMEWQPGKKGWGNSVQPDKLTIALRGGEYLGRPRWANLTFVCDTTREDTAPTAWDYRLTSDEGILSVSWQTKYACPQGQGGVPAGSSPREGTSFFGFLGNFFLFVFILVILYFAAGAWYQYTQFGSRGLDLIPHRAFWADVPYMLKDMFRGTGRNSAGYSAI